MSPKQDITVLTGTENWHIFLGELHRLLKAKKVFHCIDTRNHINGVAAIPPNADPKRYYRLNNMYLEMMMDVEDEKIFPGNQTDNSLAIHLIEKHIHQDLKGIIDIDVNFAKTALDILARECSSLDENRRKNLIDQWEGLKMGGEETLADLFKRHKKVHYQLVGIAAQAPNDKRVAAIISHVETKRKLIGALRPEYAPYKHNIENTPTENLYDIERVIRNMDVYVQEEKNGSTTSTTTTVDTPTPAAPAASSHFSRSNSNYNNDRSRRGGAKIDRRHNNNNNYNNDRHRRRDDNYHYNDSCGSPYNRRDDRRSNNRDNDR
ncbi:hypothetical protein HDU76_010844, partial [Blyttiomyces sp. JEL0837]